MTRRADGGFPPTLKRLGQHFLADRRVLVAIVDALQLRGDETVVEVGPGRGALTDLLRDRAARVVAIELDRALAAMLRQRYADAPHVSIVEADVLQVSLADAAGGEYLLAGNVPYYITTPILFHALRPPPPRRAVFLVQREVAERMVARAGTAAYGALSANVQSVADAEIAMLVPPGAFRPPPKVESAVVVVTPSAQPLVPANEQEEYRKLVQAAFGRRRKQMRRVLRTVRGIGVEEADRVLAAAAIEPTARPETLTPADFARLLRAV